MEGADELIDCTVVEGVGFVYLSLPLRLRAGGVEDLIDDIGVGGLHAVVGKDVQVYLVFRAENLVDAPGNQPLPGEVARRCLKYQGAGAANGLLKRGRAASAVGE